MCRHTNLVIILKILMILAIILLFVLPVYASDVEQVCFAPGCESIIIQQIDKAQKEIRVQAYSFTSAPIAKALLDAHKRGLVVEVVLDRSNLSTKYSTITFLKNAGMLGLIDSRHAIMHDKIIIIDREIVITGSYNFTKAAETRNSENVLVIRSLEIADKYLKNWEEHRKHSE